MNVSKKNYWNILAIGFFVIWLTSNVFARADRFRVAWTASPSTSITIAWDQTSGTNAKVYFDQVRHGQDTTIYQNFQKADQVIFYKEMNNHFVHLTNLEANTIYYFVIADNESISRPLSFKTAPDNPNERLSIIAGSDSRNFRDARISANFLVSKLRPHCVMFGGDYTNRDTPEEWKDWLDDWQYTISSDGRIYPIVPARGNHEYTDKVIQNIFGAPSEGYYGFNIGGDLLRIYTLNSMITPGGEQKDWLSEDLSNNQSTTWKTAQYHIPMKTHVTTKFGSLPQWIHWAHLFYEYGMNLIVESDSHVMKSTYPVRPDNCKGSEDGFIRDDESGSVYIGEGCWGAPLRRNDNDKSWTRASDRFNGFHWIFVDNSKVEVRFVKTDDSILVPELNDDEIFSMPAFINIWEPENGSGSVIRIKKLKPIVEFTPYIGSSIQFSPITPNPFSETVYFHYEVKKPIVYSTARLLVKDISGKILYKQEVQLSVGCHEYPFTYVGLNSSLLFCFLEVDNKIVEQQQFVYIR